MSTQLPKHQLAAASHRPELRSRLHRFFSDHRRPLAVGAVGALILVGLLAGWSVTPGLLAEELEERLEDRFGLDLELNDLEMGRRSVALTDLSLSSPEGDLELQIDRLRVMGDLTDLAQRREGALERIRIDGAQLTFDLDHPAAASRVAAWRDLLSSGPEVESEPEIEQTSGLGSLDRWFRLLQDDAHLEVVQADLRLIENGEIRGILSVDRSGVTRRGAREFELEGQARHDDGRLDWDLRANLGELSAHGTVGWSDLPVAELLRRFPQLPVVEPEEIRSSGRARVRADGSTRRLTAEGLAQVAGLHLDSEVLADQPLRDLSVRGEGAAVVDFSESRFELLGSRWSREGVEAALDVSGSWNEGWRLEASAELPQSDCAELIRAAPAGLLGDFKGMELEGKLAGSLLLELDSRSPKATELDIDVDDRCRFVESGPLPHPDDLRAAFRQTTRGHDGEVVHIFETGPGTEAWTAIEEVSPFFLHAVLASEDAGFFRHSGFATYAVESALERNLGAGRFAFGASTLSMQLSKNLFLTRDKTVARKAQEVLATWWLERHFSKQEILELYVNVVELGPGVFGVRDAATYYFGRHPLDLSPAESVFLASLLPSPVDRSRQLQEGELWSETRQHIAWMLRHMERKQRLDAVARDHGLAQLEAFTFAGSDRTELPADPGDLGEPGELPFPTHYERRPGQEQKLSWWKRRFG